MQPVLEHSNALTRRWILEQDWASGAVLSGVGVWPLLAALAAGASGPARDELEAATGVEQGDAARGVAELVAAVRSAPCLRLALGAWARAAVPLAEMWTAALPDVATGSLPIDVLGAQAL